MANAKQKRWLNLVARYGCVTDRNQNQIQIHHVIGRSAKSNKIAIGEWCVLPLQIHLHDVGSNHAHNVTHNKRRFEARFGKQSELFAQMYWNIKNSMYNGDINMDLEALPPVAVVKAIGDYRR